MERENKMLLWARVLAAKTEEELDKIKEEANDPATDQAVAAIKKLSADEQMQQEAAAREKALRNRNSEIAES